LSVLEQECHLFDDILEETNPNFILLKSFVGHHTQLLYELCVKKNITPLILYQTRVGYRSTIAQEFDTIDGLSDLMNKNDFKIRTNEQLKNYINTKSDERSENFQNIFGYTPSTKMIILSVLKFFSQTKFSTYTDYFPNFGKTPWKLIKQKINSKINARKCYSFLEKNSIKQIPENIPFVYFPLHVEPERTLSIDAPYFTNQLEVISNVAKALPIEYQLFVKEHPMQINSGNRAISFYKQILELPNVKLFHKTDFLILLFR